MKKENHHFYRPDYGVFEKLLGKSFGYSMDIYQDFPWDDPPRGSGLGLQITTSVLEGLPEFDRLDQIKKAEIKTKESLYHLSNLWAGEHFGIVLASQIITESSKEFPDWPYFMGTILADERNHALLLGRYLHDRVGLSYRPHPRLMEVMEILSTVSFELKLLIGQVVLEWTASSLLSSLLLKRPEPLLGKILQKVLRDESQHILMDQYAFAQVPQGRMEKIQKQTEELLFEFIVGNISSFFAVPIWQEYGLSKSGCRIYTAQVLDQLGVFHFFSKILPLQLARCRIRCDRLVPLLEKNLLVRLLNDQWEFAPHVLFERKVTGKNKIDKE